MNKGLEIRYNTDKQFKSLTEIMIDCLSSGLIQDDIIQAIALAELKIAERKKEKHLPD